MVSRQEQLKAEGDEKVAALQEQLRVASELLGRWYKRMRDDVSTSDTEL